MIILLSPSKTLNMDADTKSAPTPTSPRLLERSAELVGLLKKKASGDIQSLMSVSQKIADLNVDRYQRFSTPFSENNATPCIFAFKGDVYDGLDVAQFSQDDLSRAQESIRILSGLYGLLRPLDLMQAYRLEMGTKLPNNHGENLYDFWGSAITDLINSDLKASCNDLVINLASNEYFKAVQPKNLSGQLITPIFKEQKGESFKVIGIYAKKARGMMTRYLTQKQIDSVEGIKGFNEDGYVFNATLSNETDIVFTRQQT